MRIAKQELDASGCSSIGCTHDHSVVYFHGRCHPHADVSACYEKATGEIVIRCARCEALIARVAVAA